MAFIRPAGVGANAIHVLALSPAFEPIGSPVPVTTQLEVPLLDLAWAGDDAALVFSSGALFGQSRLHRLPLRSDRLAPSGPASVLPFGEQAATLSLSRGGRLVYADQSRDTRLERMNVAGRAGSPLAAVVAASTYDETTPAYSRDGKRIAFASTRTGNPELWVSNADGTNLRQVTFIGGPYVCEPAVVSHRRRADPVQLPARRTNALYVLDLGTGTTQRLTNDGREYVEARWSRDGKWIYAGSARTGRLEGVAHAVNRRCGRPDDQERRHRRERGRRWVPVLREGGTQSPTSIWRMPVAGGPETLVVEGLSYSINFAVGDRGLYFVSRGESRYDTAVEYLEFGSLTRTRLADLGRRALVVRRGAQSRPAMVHVLGGAEHEQQPDGRGRRPMNHKLPSALAFSRPHCGWRRSGRTASSSYAVAQ